MVLHIYLVFSIGPFISGSLKLKTTEPSMLTKLFTKNVFKKNRQTIFSLLKQAKNEPKLIFSEKITKNVLKKRQKRVQLYFRLHKPRGVLSF